MTNALRVVNNGPKLKAGHRPVWALKRQGMDAQERQILGAMRQYMADRGESQAGLARRLSTLTGERWTQPKIWKILEGRIVLSLPILLVFCHVLNVSLLEMLGRALVPVPGAPPKKVKHVPLKVR